MQFQIVPQSNFRRIYLPFVGIMTLAVAAAWLLLLAGRHYPHPEGLRNLARPVLFVMIFAAAAHTSYQRRSLARLQQEPEFAVRLQQYERFYRIRLLWFLVSCVISCALALFTARTLFIWFALFDLGWCLICYPFRALIRRELSCDELEFC